MELFDTITRELRHSARTLWRSRAFSAINLITLAAGIGATTAIYTVLDAVVLRPLPYRNADRLVSVLHPATVPGNGESKWGLSSAGYFYFKKENHTLEDLGGYQTSTATVTGVGSAENVRAGIVTYSIFSTLGARAESGRLISADDDQPGAGKVVVLSHEYWERAFGGDRAAVGRMLQTSDGDYQIIGVAEPGLTLPKPGPFASTADLAGFGVDVWFPEQLNPNGRPINSHQYSGIGRLKPGVTPQQAQADFARLMTRFPELFPTAYSTEFLKKYNFRVGIIPLRDEVLGPVVGKALWILFGAVAVVLIIACANVANLFLVRLESRRREAAIRGALGGSRAQLAAHYLSESLLLTTTAGVAGIADRARLAWRAARRCAIERSAPRRDGHRWERRPVRDGAIGRGRDRARIDSIAARRSGRRHAPRECARADVLTRPADCARHARRGSGRAGADPARRGRFDVAELRESPPREARLRTARRPHLQREPTLRRLQSARRVERVSTGARAEDRRDPRRNGCRRDAGTSVAGFRRAGARRCGEKENPSRTTKSRRASTRRSPRRDFRDARHSGERPHVHVGRRRSNPEDSHRRRRHAQARRPSLARRGSDWQGDRHRRRRSRILPCRGRDPGDPRARTRPAGE